MDEPPPAKAPLSAYQRMVQFVVVVATLSVADCRGASTTLCGWEEISGGAEQSMKTLAYRLMVLAQELVTFTAYEVGWAGETVRESLVAPGMGLPLASYHWKVIGVVEKAVTPRVTVWPAAMCTSF